MRTPRLLLFSTGQVLGHSSLGYAEFCGSGSSLTPLDGAPVCFPGPEYLAAAQTISNQLSTPSWECQNGRDCGSPRRHAWTHSSPCFQSAESEQELCVFTDTNFADGRGISFVTTPRRASYLATTRAFAEPETTKGINQDLVRTIPAKYEVREIPGKGMGLIATNHILRGDLIMANTASYMFDYRAFNELPKAEYTQLQAHAVDHLPSPHRAAILNLSSHASDTTTGLSHPEHIAKISATNIFDIDPADDDPEDQHHSFAALFPEISRMNHDCRPNAEYRFDYATLAQSIHAARDIAPGEEITLSYIDPLMAREARMRKLRRNWGFECSCPLCMLDGARAAESDGRIRQIGELRSELKDWGVKSKGCPGMAELLVSFFEMERLWTVMHEAYVLAALEYNAAGEVWMAVKYARLAVEWGVPMVGEGDEDLEDMMELVGDPRGHWSWMGRVKRG